MSAPKTYQDALLAAAAADPRVVVMTAENRAAIRQVPEKLGGRFIDVGICEQTMIGAAAGLALRGRVPVVHALATFLTMRAFEFIRSDVGIGRLPVKLVGGVPGFLSDGNGPTHQAIEDVALMRGIPGMEIICPTDEEELAAALPAILQSPRPAYIRYVGGAARVPHPAPYQLGKAELLAEGDDVALLSYGLLVGEVARAAEVLAADGIRARVLNLRTLAPLDSEAVLRAVRETPLVVTVEDHFLTGGLYTIVAELTLKHRLAPRTLPLALDQRWFRPALLPDVLEREGFTAARIAARVRRALAGESDV
jgi:transketolase